MEVGEKVQYRGEEYGIILISEGAVHILNENGGYAIIIEDFETETEPC